MVYTDMMLNQAERTVIHGSPPNVAKQLLYERRANGVRYPLVGGTRQRRFDGTSPKPRKLLENAPSPTSRVHAVLGGLYKYACNILRNLIKLSACTTRILRSFSRFRSFNVYI